MARKLRLQFEGALYDVTVRGNGRRGTNGVKPETLRRGLPLHVHVDTHCMARKLRLQFEGALYHVTVRGNGRRKIFLDDADRERLLWRLGESVELYGVRLYLFCLMDNHFHLLVETPRANISRFMQSVLTGYTVYFNRRHNSVGHLLQEGMGRNWLQETNTC